MYAEKWVFNSFVAFMKKNGRAQGLTSKDVQFLLELYKKSINSGSNSLHKKGKFEIDEMIKNMRMSNKSYSREEAEKINAFLTPNPEKVSKMILTKNYPQLEFNFGGNRRTEVPLLQCDGSLVLED